MGMNENSKFHFAQSKKNLVAGVIVAISAIIIAVMLSVTAFATGLGEDVLQFLFRDPANISQDGADISYPANSYVFTEDASDSESNASSTVTVNFTNNYADERAKEVLAEPQTQIVENEKPFSFTAGIDATTYGSPSAVNFDAKSGLSYSINPTTHAVTFTSVVGITSDVVVDIAYGQTVYPYTLHIYYEDEDGQWGNYDSYDRAAPLGTKIPTQADKEISQKVTHEYDAESTSSVVTEDGEAVASLYYRCKMVEVTFDNNGGFGGPGAFSKRVGALIPEAANKMPIRAGYDFDGWYTQEEGGTEVVIPDEGYTVPSEDIVLYAHWTVNAGYRWMTIVYWGENAEITENNPSGNLIKEDYSYISECYIQGALDEEFIIDKDHNKEYVAPHAGKEGAGLHVLETLDLDGDGEPDDLTSNCYYLTVDGPDEHNAICDPATSFQADNYAVYNVYLKRVEYTYEFWDDDYGRETPSVEPIGSITARWGQVIYDEFCDICKDAWPDLTIDNCPWVTYGDQHESGNADWRSQAIFTHMDRENHVGYYEKDGSKGFQKRTNAFPSQNNTNVRYYIQKIDADDAHSNIQSAIDTSGNYELFASMDIAESYGSQFSEEELMPIEGFTAPDGTAVRVRDWELPYYSDTVDAPGTYKDAEGHYYQTIGYWSFDEAYSGWNFYYKRNSHTLNLMIIKPMNEENVYWEPVSDIDYEKKIGDVSVPEGIPGSFNYPAGVEHNRQLRYFTPENPGYGKLDANFKFDGWALNNGVGSESVDLDTVYMPNSDLSIYAKWSAPEVTITFNQVSQPKTEHIAQQIPVTATYNTKLVSTSIPVPTEFPKHYFEYWYYHGTDDQGHDVKFYFNPETMSVPPHNLNLFPEYSCNEMDSEYSVTFENDSVTSHGTIETSSNPAYAVKNTKITLDENVLTVEDTFGLNWGAEATATGLTDATGTYIFDHWEVNDGSGWATLTTNYEITSNIQVKPVFVRNGEEEPATITKEPIPATATYTGEAISTLSDPGEAENGTMMYAVSVNEAVQPPLNEFSENVPTMLNAGSYYVYYYAAGDYGYVGSDVGMVVATVNPSQVTATIKYTETTAQYTGSQIVVKGHDCYTVTVPEGTTGFDSSKVDTEILLYVQGTEVGTYTGQAWGGYMFTYNDANFDVSFIRDSSSANAPKLNIVNDIEEVPVPTWKEGSLTYNGEEQFALNPADWNDYDPEKLDLKGGTYSGTNAQMYTASFTTKAGYVFPSGATTALATWSIDQLDMTIYPYGIVIYRDADPSGYNVVVEGYECFDANVAPASAQSAFDLTKVHATWPGDTEEIYISAREGHPSDSDWFDKYEWTYDDNNVNADFVVSDDDYSTLIVGSQPPTVNPLPVKADDFEADGSAHSAFKSPGVLSDTDNFKLYYAVTDSAEAPEASTEIWKDSISQVTIEDPGTYWAWYAVYTNGEKKGHTVISATSVGTVNVSDPEPEPTAVPKPTWKQDILYDAKSHDVHDTSFWNGYDTDAMTIGGTVAATSPTTYFASFTLKDGYKWTDEEADVRIANVSWKIVATTVPMPTWKDDILYDGQTHDVSDTSYWNNFNTDAMTIGGEVSASASGTYTAVFTLKDGYIWQGVEPTARTANGAWGIFIEEVSIPTWKEDLPYTGQEYDVSVNPELYWNNFYADAMSFGGTYKATAAGTYTATFTLEPGYGWIGMSETDRSIDRTWKIVSSQEKEDNPFTFEPEEPWILIGETILIQVNDLGDNAALTWETQSGSGSEITATVLNFGIITATGTGNTTFAVTSAETTNYKETTKTFTVKSGERIDQDISFDVSEDLNVGEVGKIEVLGLEEKPDITWSISEGSDVVEFVSSTTSDIVNYKGLKAGTAKLKIKTTETAHYNAIEEIVQVTIKNKLNQNIVFDKESLTLEIGEEGTVTASGMKESPALSWSVGDEDVVTITSDVDKSNVVVKGVSTGETTLTLEVAETASYAKTTKQIPIIVSEGSVAFLANRPDSFNSIIANYAEATSVKFSAKDSTEYSSDYINIDIDNTGIIKAYKVSDGNGYKVVIASPLEIASSEMSLAGIFKNFVNLKEVDFGSLNTTNATSLRSMFYGCKDITSVVLSTTNNAGFDTSNVTDFGFMFGSCKSLATFDIGDHFVVKPVASLSQMFSGCYNLNNIFTPSGTDWSSTEGDSSLMFNGCTNLPDFVAKDINCLRAYCGEKSGVRGYFKVKTPGQDSYLVNRDPVTNKSIIADYFEAKSVTFVSDTTDVFSDIYIKIDVEGLGDIKAYKVEENGSYSVVIASHNNIAASATSLAGLFKDFTKLETVNFGNLNTESATSLRSMFYNCEALTSVSITSSHSSGFTTANVTDFSYMFAGKCKSLVTIVFDENFVPNTTSDISRMFYGCNALSSIKVIAGTDWSNNTGASSDMFYGCTKLPNFDPAIINNSRAYSGIKGNVKGYFTETTPGTSYLLNRETGNLSILDQYKEAESVEFKSNDSSPYSTEYIPIDIGKSGEIKAYKVTTSTGYKVIVASENKIATSETSFAGIFKGFEKLTSVDLGAVDVSNSTSLRSMFYGCTALTNVVLASNAVNGLDTSRVNDFGYMFSLCKNITIIDLSEGIIVNENASLEQMFSGCEKLSLIFVPEGTDWTANVAKSSGMFNGCKKLDHFTPDAIDASRAYVGQKGDVYGYFSLKEDPGVRYLINKDASKTTGILAEYNQATSVLFSCKDSSTYGNDYLVLDWLDNGDIKAYKVDDGQGGYKVIVASPWEIATGETTLQSLFKEFVNLKSVDFGSLDISYAKNIRSLFYGCTSLTSVTLKSTHASGFNTSNVTDFSFCFANCKSIVDINLDEGFVVNNTAALTQMFSMCEALQKINVQAGTDWSSNTGGSNLMFQGCVKLTNFEAPNYDCKRAYVGDKQGVLGYFTVKGEVGNSYLKNRDSSFASIISDYKDAESVEIRALDSNVYSSEYINIDKNEAGKIKAYKVNTSSGYKVIIASPDNICADKLSLASFFKDFTKLTSFNLGKLNTTSAESTRSMFYNCTSLTSVVLSSMDTNGFDTSQVLDFSFMFACCKKLQSVEFSSTVSASKVASFEQTFSGCEALKTIYVPRDFDLSSNTGSSKNMFYGCKVLTNFNASCIDCSRAYAGEKDGVKGYFTIKS